MNSFLGGASGFGSSVPDYGSVGAGYTGDFFGGSSSGGGLGDIGSSILQGLGRGILGGLETGLSGPQSASGPSASRGLSYTDRTKDNMNSLLALALRSFETPRSVI